MRPHGTKNRHHPHVGNLQLRWFGVGIHPGAYLLGRGKRDSGETASGRAGDHQAAPFQHLTSIHGLRSMDLEGTAIFAPGLLKSSQGDVASVKTAYRRVHRIVLTKLEKSMY